MVLWQKSTWLRGYVSIWLYWREGAHQRCGTCCRTIHKNKRRKFQRHNSFQCATTKPHGSSSVRLQRRDFRWSHTKGTSWIDPSSQSIPIFVLYRKTIMYRSFMLSMMSGCMVRLAFDKGNFLQISLNMIHKRGVAKAVFTTL